MIHEKMEELIPIVSELVQKYTSNESTSVTYEKAQQLMEAVIFCMEEGEQDALNMGTEEVMRSELSAREMYQKGYGLVKKKTDDALELYHSVMGDFDSYHNRALHDTIMKGMPEFFRYYDIRFEPQNQILTLDYPTLISVDGLKGIDAIYQYLIYIQLEQDFMRELQSDYIESCLLAYHTEYEELFINIAGIVLRSLLSEMAGGEQELARRKQMDIKELEEWLLRLLKVLLREKYNDNSQLYEYLAADVHEFAAFLKFC